MTLLDWLIVVAANGAIVGYGLLLARGTRRSSDWFLAAKSLPWWMVGLSMFATAVDSGDYVAVVGGAYTFGLSNLTTWWLGLPIGWLVAAYFVFLPLYRGGMFTNAEYLEYRFGPAARLLSAFIQIQSPHQRSGQHRLLSLPHLLDPDPVGKLRLVAGGGHLHGGGPLHGDRRTEVGRRHRCAAVHRDADGIRHPVVGAVERGRGMAGPGKPLPADRSHNWRTPCCTSAGTSRGCRRP